MFNKKKKDNKDKVELSLIIDDDTRTSIQIDVRSTTDDKILQICSSICVQYDLPSKIKKLLFNQILKELTEIRKEKQKEDLKETKCVETIKRLYYESMTHNDKKRIEIESLRKENLENMMKNYSFTPKINRKSNLMLERNYYKIEDRLFGDHKNFKEKKNYERLMLQIANRNREDERSNTPKHTGNQTHNMNTNYNRTSFNIMSTTNSHENFTRSNNKDNRKNDHVKNKKIIVINDDKLNTRTQELINKKDNLGIVNFNNNVNNTEINPNPDSKNVKKLEKINSASSGMTGTFGAINSFNTNSNTYFNNGNTGNYFSTQVVNSSISKDNSNNLNMFNNQNNINHMAYTLNANSRKISFKSSNVANSNSYTEKYEKILNLKTNTNLQNNSILGNQNNMTPIITETPTPFNEPEFNIPQCRQVYNSSQDLPQVNMKQVNIKDPIGQTGKNSNVSKFSNNLNKNTNFINKDYILNTFSNENDKYREESPSSLNDLSLLKIEHFQDFSSREHSPIIKKRSQTSNIKKVKKKEKVNTITTEKRSSSVNKVNGKWYDRLYRANEEVLKRKEDMRERQLRNECSFQPRLSKETKSLVKQIRKPEDKINFLNRLSHSKKVTNHLLTQSRIFNTIESNTMTIRSKSKSKSQSSRNILTMQTNNSANFFLNLDLKKTQSINSGNSANNQLYLSTNSPKKYLTSTVDVSDKRNTYMDKRKSIRDSKKEKSLNGEIYEIKQSKEKANKMFKEKFNENIMKFKLNNLKDLYEAVSTQNENSKEFERIPEHIKERLLIPAISIIKNKNIEFNFQNFYLIANEILNSFFN